MLKNARWIKEHAAAGMLTPFVPELVREFLIFRHVPGTVMNPKRFNPANLEPAPLHRDEDGSYFILPAHSYGLGVALERLPSDSALRRMQRLNRHVTSLPHWAVPQPPHGGEVADA